MTSFIFSFPTFTFLWCVLLPFLPFLPSCSPLPLHQHDPPLASCLLAGNLRLQQIVNPIDPLEILADVHWTHIRQKEEEEKVGPASKSSTSRGKHVPVLALYTTRAFVSYWSHFQRSQLSFTRGTFMLLLK